MSEPMSPANPVTKPPASHDLSLQTRRADMIALMKSKKDVAQKFLKDLILFLIIKVRCI